MTFTVRDYDYIEARLLAPTPDLHDAHERLVREGHTALAERLMRVLRSTADECRAIRKDMGPRP